MILIILLNLTSIKMYSICFNSMKHTQSKIKAWEFYRYADLVINFIDSEKLKDNFMINFMNIFLFIIYKNGYK